MFEKVPAINLPSDRLVGLEVELDSCGTEFRAPRCPEGWVEKSDGSLRNGREYVMEPPVPFNQCAPVIKDFSQAVETARTNIGKRGGLHVHVQAGDVTTENAYTLVRIYSHYQDVINKLLAPSRTNNSYCPPYTQGISKAQMVSMFSLNTAAENRYQAKSTRTYSVVNLAMLRCREPSHRSLEFRQGSSSSRFENLYGWTAFVCALTEISKLDIYRTVIARPGTRVELTRLLQAWERRTGCSGVSKWVNWRWAYMNARPTPALIDKAVSTVANTPHGIFHIGRQLNINLNFARKIMDAAVIAGKARKTGASQWRGNVIEDDLDQLEAAYAESLTRPAPQPIVQPIQQPQIEDPEGEIIPTATCSGIHFFRISNSQGRHFYVLAFSHTQAATIARSSGHIRGEITTRVLSRCTQIDFMRNSAISSGIGELIRIGYVGEIRLNTQERRWCRVNDI